MNDGRFKSTDTTIHSIGEDWALPVMATVMPLMRGMHTLVGLVWERFLGGKVGAMHHHHHITMHCSPGPRTMPLPPSMRTTSA